jgi:hypothetical protein
MNRKVGVGFFLVVVGLGITWFAWDLNQSSSALSVKVPVNTDSQKPSVAEVQIDKSSNLSQASPSDFKSESLPVLNSLSEETEGRTESSAEKKEKPVPYSRILNLIRKEKVVNRIETETDKKGVRSSLTVYANGPTKMRTLLQEDWVNGPNGPELIGWSAMAADYILVKIEGSPNSSEFAAKINDFRAKISATAIPGIYKVHFDGTDPITLHEIKDGLKTVADVDFSEPDYIMGIE